MRAVARRGDPDTSWAAAASLDPNVLRESQRVVLRLLREDGPMDDEHLVSRLAGVLSPSGARTRRAELVAKGLVYDTGQRVTLLSGRKAIVWSATAWKTPSLWDMP